MPATNTLETVPGGVRDAIQKDVKNCIYRYALARIAEKQEKFDEKGEFKFDPKERRDKPWDSFENQCSDNPETKVKAPITVSTDAALALAVPFVLLGNLVNKVGKLPGKDAVKALVEAPHPEAKFVKALVAVTSAMEKSLCEQYMIRNFGHIDVFRCRLDGVVQNKNYMRDGTSGSDVADLFLKFLKTIACFAGNAAWEAKGTEKGLTLNLEVVYRIMADLEFLAGPVFVELLNLMKEQVTDVQEVNAKTKKRTPRKAASKQEAETAVEQKEEKKEEEKKEEKKGAAPAKKGQPKAAAKKPAAKSAAKPVPAKKPATKPPAAAPAAASAKKPAPSPAAPTPKVGNPSAADHSEEVTAEEPHENGIDVAEDEAAAEAPQEIDYEAMTDELDSAN